MNLNDQELLNEYCERRCEAAFTEFVRRHIDFVHSAALRMVHDPHLAEDVTQGVFLAVARNAVQLQGCGVVAGWLHRTARNLAANAIRSEVRRRTREQEAAKMDESQSPQEDPLWNEIAPWLDEALTALGQRDRDVLLLRYFERKSAREMALTLGTTEEAAQKRVTRAIDRLRRFFVQRGITVSASALAMAISANGLQAAPAGLIASVSANALLAASTLATTTVTTTKLLIMTTLQKTAIITVIATAAGVGAFRTHQAAKLRSELAALQEQQTPLAEQLRQLQRERDEAELKLARLVGQLAAVKDQPNELLKLRGEAGRLRQEIAEKNDPFVRTALNWKEKETRLRQLFQENPEQNIPELQLLDARAWLNAAMTADLDTEAGKRRVMSGLRQTAENTFVIQLEGALRAFRQQNPGQFPTELAALKPFLESPEADAFLQRYEFRPAPEFPTHHLGSQWYITQKAAVDPEFDVRWVIGANGFGQTKFKTVEQNEAANAQ